MTQTQLILGLPKAGKTTFIAALWYVVESARVPGALELAELPPNRKHLNGIRDLWVQCREQGHTSVGSEREIQLKLRDAGSERITELIVPDLSGESFELQWSHRQWSSRYNELASRANGALLFIHPDRVTDAPTIPEEEALGDVLRDPPGATAETAAIKETPPIADDRPWDASLAAPQVKLVEILQFLTVRPFSRPNFRLAVIISAWDRVKKEGIPPAEWLSHRMPYLDQFLRANREVFQTQVYGLSATGGDLETEADRLLALQNPENRIEIVGPTAAAHDVTAPVRYLMI